MKIIFVFMLAATVMLSAFVKMHEYAEVKINTREDIKFLQDNDIDIDRTGFGQGGKPIDGKVTVYVTEHQFSLLTEKGLSAKWTPSVLPADKNSYRFNEAIGDSMLIWQNRYPDICERIQIGSSVEGRPLWVLKITDSLNIEEAEPEVKFISSIHGDEVTGL